jgi:hypothetical protein
LKNFGVDFGFRDCSRIFGGVTESHRQRGREKGGVSFLIFEVQQRKERLKSAKPRKRLYIRTKTNSNL